MKPLNILIACEESQRVCIEFRKFGHNAYSCDLISCSGGHPEWHFKEDAIQVIQDKGGRLEAGTFYNLQSHWDLMIAHPPCTYLSSSGARWFYHPEDKHLPIEERRPHPRFPTREADKQAAITFFLKLAQADITHIAIENPIGIMSTIFRKPDQIIQPYYFGEEASKSTCLWLKNLTPLKPTNIVGKGEFLELASGKRLPKWYADALTLSSSAEERRRLRSKTFIGIARAMASQWSTELSKLY